MNSELAGVRCLWRASTFGSDMKEIPVRWMALAVLSCIVAAGCAKNARPSAAATLPASQPSISASSAADIRVGEISRLSEDYASLSQQLPGRTSEEYRQVMRNVFDQLDQILSLLTDPRSDLVFRQHLMVLEDARAQLGASPPEATVDPTSDTGLRSAYNALSEITHDKDFADEDFTAPLADMKTRLDELDTVQGLTHQVVVGEAVAASSVIVSKMAELLSSRIVTLPTSEASTLPTSAPASEPATSQPGAVVPQIAEPTSQPGTTVPEPK